MPSQKVHSAEGLTAEFRQSEILSAVRQYSVNAEENHITKRIHEYCVILSQDCDLLQDFNKRKDGKPGGLNGILLFEARTVGASKAGGMGAKEFDKIAQNNNERYHFLQAAPAEDDTMGAGIPDLIIDFKKYFTISSTDLHWQISLPDGPKRRCRLVSPYVEHLQLRASFYMSRIGLPVPHAPSSPFSQVLLPPTEQ